MQENLRCPGLAPRHRAVRPLRTQSLPPLPQARPQGRAAPILEERWGKTRLGRRGHFIKEGLGRPSSALHRLRRLAAPPCPCAGCPALGGTSPFPRSPSPCGGSLTPRSPPHGSTTSGALPPVDTRPRVAPLALPEEGLGRPSPALHRLRRLAAPPCPCAGCPARGGTSPFPRSPSPCGGSLTPRSPPHGSTTSGAQPPVDTHPRRG